MAEDDLSHPPRQAKGEIAEGLVKAGLAAIPVVGGSAAEVVGLFLQPAVQRRREEWLRRLGEAVEELRQRADVGDIEALAHNETFITVVLNASMAAMRTHQQEKLDALKNAVENSALAIAPDEHTQMMFLGFLDELTPVHLQILAYLRNPSEWFEKGGIPRPDTSGARSIVLEAAFPQLHGRAGFYSQVVRELGTRGLAQESGLSGMVSAHGLWDALTTPLGNQFLDYIEPPPAA
jgi:hypothetical protein